MARNKKFDFGKNNYYFEIKNGGLGRITIKRKDRDEAEYSYLNYRRVGKTCEWLGKWDGKKFIENEEPKLK